MQKTIPIVVAVVLAAGLAVAAVINGISRNHDSIIVANDPSSAGTSDVEARLASLEAAITVEREARQLLEDELLFLYETLDSIESNGEPTPSAVGGNEQNRRPAVTRSQFIASGRNDPEQRKALLIAAGFSDVRAEWLLQRESELRMEAMQLRYEAMRSPDGVRPIEALMSPDRLLRNEIGDAEYELYLEAQNLPTSVNINSVFGASPAQTAGLQQGDRITHYDGERVYSTFDLTRQTMEGEPGANVVVDFIRDGVPMQVVMQRGPLGIRASRRR